MMVFLDTRFEGQECLKYVVSRQYASSSSFVSDAGCNLALRGTQLTCGRTVMYRLFSSADVTLLILCSGNRTSFLDFGMAGSCGAGDSF